MTVIRDVWDSNDSAEPGVETYGKATATALARVPNHWYEHLADSDPNLPTRWRRSGPISQISEPDKGRKRDTPRRPESFHRLEANDWALLKSSESYRFAS